MPNPLVGAVGLLVGLISAGPSLALDCAMVLDVAETANDGLRAELSVPCQPYAAVDVIYGPFSISEETSLDGGLTLDLPRIAGAETLSVMLKGARVDADIPPADQAAQPYLAVSWPDGVRWGQLVGRSAESGLDSDTARHLGFPAPDAQTLDFLPLSTSSQPQLVVPVREDNCAQRLSAVLTTSDRPAPRVLSVTMPPCDRLGEVLTIPLG